MFRSKLNSLYGRNTRRQALYTAQEMSVFHGRKSFKVVYEYYDLFSNIQSGFRSRRRTTDHIIRLHDLGRSHWLINIT